MADLTEMKNVVRKGTVQKVDDVKMKARVKFGDKGGITSGELHILIRPRHIVPAKDDKEGDKVATEKEHCHNAYLTEWIPKIGDMVLCLMVPDGDGEGYILGRVK